LIWLILVSIVFVGGGAWLVARSWLMRGIVFFAGAAAVAVYMVVGRPNMVDDPLAQRVERISAQLEKTGPEGLTEDDILVYAEAQAKKRPDNPGPHLAIGTIMESRGQARRALEAYEEALRRAPNEIDAIKRLADLRFKMTGEFDEATTALYNRAWELEPTNFRFGYFAGIGDWLNGRKDKAEALWTSIEAQNPPEQMKQMFAAFQDQFKIVRVPAKPPQTKRPPR
jgi:cytochrome c-type biogenesis protein CcmH/NrfG